jgi:hypothetical protein
MSGTATRRTVGIKGGSWRGARTQLTICAYAAVLNPGTALEATAAFDIRAPFTWFVACDRALVTAHSTLANSGTAPLRQSHQCVP